MWNCSAFAECGCILLPKANGNAPEKFFKVSLHLVPDALEAAPHDDFLLFPLSRASIGLLRAR